MNLYGTAVLLEELGKVIVPGGVGVTISSQSGHRMPALTPEADFLIDGGATVSYFYGPLKPENRSISGNKKAVFTFSCRQPFSFDFWNIAMAVSGCSSYWFRSLVNRGDKAQDPNQRWLRVLPLFRPIRWMYCRWFSPF